MQNHAAYNEKDLLQQVATGSEEAFGILFHAYRNKLYAYILKLSGSPETASDTVHEVFLLLWQRREKCTEIENLNNYLYRMAHNEAFHLFQRRSKEILMLAQLQKERGLPASFEGEDRIIHQEVLTFIQKAVNQLTPQQKQVFLLSREQGMKLADIAAHLGISERTVKNHITSALRFLREQMRETYGGYAIILCIMYDLAHPAHIASTMG